MKIKVKRFDEISCRHYTLGCYNIDEDSLVSQLKNIVSQYLLVDNSYFHFEGYILGIKIILTESFPLNFFFSNEMNVIFIEFHHYSIKQSKFISFEEAVCSVNSNNEVQLQNILLNSTSIEEDFILKKHVNGWSLLHYASISGNAPIVKMLLKYGWNINEETDDAWTPLMLACAHGDMKCTAELLRHSSIQINKLSKRGSALHLAVCYGHAPIVMMLLNSKASYHLEDYNHKIPLELATDNEIIELIPKFQGNCELQKYIETEKPPPFGGILSIYNTFRLTDRSVFLFLNLDTGILEEYLSKDDFIRKESPALLLKIIDIQQVTSTKSKLNLFRTFYYFKITLSIGIKYYYTKHEEYRDEWIKQIANAIQYCQIHKIGIDNSNKFEFEVIERQISENHQSFVEDDEVTLEDFERLSEIGSGSFGTVYQVIKKDTGVIYAMKCLSKFFLNKKKMLKYAISEIKIMKQLNHSFILGLSFAIQTASNLYLILEYCEGGDLENVLDKRKIPELEAKFYIAEIILGLEYLHSLDIIYRDLKPANILLDSRGHIRLADFGLAKTFDEAEDSVSTLLGSPAYISPEIICHERLSKAADIYSLGVVMHELLTGKIPFIELQIDRLFQNIKNGKFFISETLGKDAKDLIKKLLNRKPEKRPKFDEIKKHEYFTRIDWELLENKQYVPPQQHL